MANHGGRLVGVLGLMLGMVSADVVAQARPPADEPLGQLIEHLTDRRSNGLIFKDFADGSASVDLQGRFQQVALAQFIGDDLPMTQCVNSVEEANVFFGRDLLTGGPLPPEAIAEHEALVEEARRHSMSVPEYQFYRDLIEQGSAAPQLSAGSTITIVNNDGPNEGFNSTAPQFLPAPGNDGNANLGDQRLALFNAAADIWGAFLDSSVTIEILAQFDPLAPCSTFGGVLGSAGAITAHGNFANAEYTNTFYHAALANKQAGRDLSQQSQDLSAQFNSSVDTGCLGADTHFYYGLDNATPAGTVNLFVVLLHEMGHGLGSSSFTGSNGQFWNGFPDIWARFLFDTTAGLTWFQMNDAQRKDSAVNTNNVYWNGANVRVASGFLSDGRDADTGRVQMYTPNPYEGGSSVSHYNTAASPNLLMEPSINSGLPLTLDLTRQQMRDIGWYRDSSNDLVPDTITNVAPSGGSLEIGSQQNITWTNTGSFSNNVTIELSLDGGTTWPNVIASDVANTGSYAWVVPNSPTSQARVRVREHDFLAPLGQSVANFIISSDGNTAPTFTPAGAQSRQQGSPSGAAVAVGTVSDGQSAAGDLAVTQLAGGTATGITVDSISNTGGTVTATLAATCAATAGTVRFEVSDNELANTGDLQVNVSANSAPILSYANAAVDGFGGTEVNPLAGPSDNGSITSIVVQDNGTYSGTISVDLAGAISVSNAQPIGQHTITIRATDNCGEFTDTVFQLTVNNTAPTFTPAGAQPRQQGSPSGAAVTVGTVSDGQTAAGDLVVTQVAGGTATGITVGSISNTDGVVAATLAATCTATTGTVRFEVSDGDLSGNGDLQLNVSVNTPPTVGVYPLAKVGEGLDLLIYPDVAPADNGTVDNMGTAVEPNTYTGGVSANPATGEVNLEQAGPAGAYTVTVTLSDNCGAMTNRNITVEVLGEDIFANGFEM